MHIYINDSINDDTCGSVNWTGLCSVFPLIGWEMMGSWLGGVRYTPEFRERAVRLPGESRASYSSETAGDRRRGGGPGGLRGVVGAVAQRERREGVRRHGPRGDGRVGGGQASARGERAAAPRERDPDDGVGFFRGEARPDTAMMVEYIDAHRDRFGVGADLQDAGRGAGAGVHRRTRLPGVQGAAGRAGGGRATRALARDVMEIHSDFFMAV